MLPRLSALMLFFLLVGVSGSIGAQSESAAGWQTIETGGMCSAGAPYQFHVHDSPVSDHLLIFFSGGGACWWGQACDTEQEPHFHVSTSDDLANLPQAHDGIFALDHTENPVADYDMIGITYCTGDVHIGAGEHIYRYSTFTEEEVQVTVHHDGYINTMSVLDWVYERYTRPDKVVVAGSSAGAIGASFYSGLIAEHYASTPIILLSDAAGGYQGNSLEPVFSAWNTAAILPDWDEYEFKDNASLTFEDFYIASAHHNPNLTISQYNAAYDEVQTGFNYVFGMNPLSFDLAENIFSMYQQIESQVSPFYSYTAGGEEHTILNRSYFYTYEVDGIRFVDWFDHLINGEPVRDVSCADEARGCRLAPLDK